MDSKVEAQLADSIALGGASTPKTASLREARRAFERRYILAVLEQHQWRVGATANALGLQRPNLYRKARQLSIALKPSADNNVAG
jgi:DNA-binding NtrC family response regulator